MSEVNFVHVGMAFNEAYAPRAAAVIASAIETLGTGWRLNFQIIQDGVTLSSQRRLTSWILQRGHSVAFHSLTDGALSKFPESHHHRSAFARLFLPSLLPTLERLLYLDADLVITDGLEKLWQFELGENVVAAVDDGMEFFGGLEKLKPVLRMEPDQRYFNSGVLLMNLEKWRHLDISGATIDWISRNQSIMQHSDQDALNVILGHQRGSLPLRWNLQIPIVEWASVVGTDDLEVRSAIQSPGIVHYTTFRKPWKSNIRVMWRNLYFRAANRGPFTVKIKDSVAHRASCLMDSLHWGFRRTRFTLGRLRRRTSGRQG